MKLSIFEKIEKNWFGLKTSNSFLFICSLTGYEDMHPLRNRKVIVESFYQIWFTIALLSLVAVMPMHALEGAVESNQSLSSIVSVVKVIHAIVLLIFVLMPFACLLGIVLFRFVIAIPVLIPEALWCLYDRPWYDNAITVIMIFLLAAFLYIASR